MAGAFRMTETATCRTCGTEPRAGARYCDACGAPVASTPGAEYKQVTVLFADVVRSMSVMVRDLRKAVELARARYDNGYSAYLEVLDAERSLFDAEINLANSKSAHLTSVVKVCMALGGGWKE